MQALCRTVTDANGFEPATQARYTVEDEMTSVQIAYATELARACMAMDVPFGPFGSLSPRGRSSALPGPHV